MSNVIIKKVMEQIAMKIAEQWGLLPEYMAPAFSCNAPQAKG
jgi:hypothetical protein